MQGEVIFLFSVVLLIVSTTNVVTGEDKSFSYQTTTKIEHTSVGVHLVHAPHRISSVEDLSLRGVKTIMKRDIQLGSNHVNQDQIFVRLSKSIRPNPWLNRNVEDTVHFRWKRNSKIPTVECLTKELSCRGRCTRGPNAGKTQDTLFQCFCDEKCDRFQDCCMDYEKYCVRRHHHKHLSNSTRLLVPLDPKSSQATKDSWNCIRVLNTREGASIGIWMIRSCHQNWTDSTVRIQCENNTPTSHRNLLDALPVVARNGKTYMNRFCAQCRGVSLTALSPYQLKFSCDVSPPSHYNEVKATEFLFSHCQSVFTPNVGLPRRYCYGSNTVSSCSKKLSVALQNKCNNSITGIVYSKKKGKRYRNIYCSMCDNVGSLQCKRPTSHSISNSIVPSYPSPFSVIMDFRFLGTRQKQPLKVKRRTRVSCPPYNMFYDSYLEMCRATKPIVPRKATFNKYRVSTWIQKSKVKGCFARSNISFSSTSTFGFSNHRGDYHSLDDKESISRALSDFFSVNRTLLLNTETIKNKNYIIFVFELKLKPFSENSKIRALTEFVEPITLIADCTIYRIFKSTARRLFCFLIEEFLPDEYTFLGDSKSAVYINKTGEMFVKREYYINIKTGNITICRNNIKNPCEGTYVSLPLSEIDIYPNKSVYWKCAGQIYERTEYGQQNGTILVCSNFTCKSAEHFQQNLNNMVEVVITITGLSLSVLSSSLVLLTYTLFSELRTLPGLNLMNFTLSIALAHALMLTGTRFANHVRICTVVSYGLHFTFLASFVWSSIIAIDTWRAFSNRKQRVVVKTARKSITARKYSPYLLTGWLAPLIFVAICFVLDSNQIIAFDYTGKKGCWINNETANLYFFVLPIALMLVTNIAFFILTLTAIRTTTKRSRMATTKRQQKRQTCVYVKISTLMGFSWILGFFSNVSCYIKQAFIISSSLQGVYVALAFVFTKRVFNLYAKLLTRKNTSYVNRPICSSQTRTLHIELNSYAVQGKKANYRRK